MKHIAHHSQRLRIRQICGDSGDKRRESRCSLGFDGARQRGQRGDKAGTEWGQFCNVRSQLNQLTLHPSLVAFGCRIAPGAKESHRTYTEIRARGLPRGGTTAQAFGT